MRLDNVSKGIVAGAILVVAFLYMFNLTVDVNPHWESNLFIEGNSNDPLSYQVKEIFKINSENLLHSHGPMNGLYYKVLFSLFGYDFFYYRLVKSLIFAGTIALFFLICSTFLERRYAVLASCFVLFSFPIFIQTLVFDEGFIIGEFFKFAAIYLFILDLGRKKTSIYLQAAIIMLSVIAIRTYTAAFSIAGIFALYLILAHRNKIKRYIVLLIIIILTKIPLSLSTLHFGAKEYGLNFSVISSFFASDFTRYAFSPVPVFSSLYYRPILSVITFFGFWLFIILLGIIASRRFLHKRFPNKFAGNDMKKSSKDAFLFLAIWTVCEIPILFVIPETGIRYLAAILTPLAAIICLMMQEAAGAIKVKKTGVAAFLIALLILAMITNLSYVVLFRATWGSAFVGMDKTSTFVINSMNKEKAEKAYLYYYATSVAPEYIAVDKTRIDRYTVLSRLEPKRIEIGSFKEQLAADQNATVYVVKRLSSFNKAEYPPLDLDSYPNLKKIKIIEGKGNNLFDLSAGFIAGSLGIPYSPNLFYVYMQNMQKNGEK